METIDILVEDAEHLVARVEERARSRAARWGDVLDTPTTSVGQGFGDLGTRLEVAVERLRDLGIEGTRRFERHGQSLSDLIQSIAQSDGTGADVLRGMVGAGQSVPADEGAAR